MRRAILITLALAVSGGELLMGQPGAAKAGEHAPAWRTHSQPAPAAAAPGPVIDATGLGSSLLLDKDWRVGITANPAAAAPGFDDSSWAIRDASGSMQDVPQPPEDAGASDHQRGVSVQVGPGEDRRHRYAWFRLHIRLAPHHGPVALLVELPVARSSTIGTDTSGPALDVYANGQFIRPEVPHADHPGRYQEISRIYDLNIPAEETSLTLALRTIYIPFGFNAYTNFFATRKVSLGYRSDLEPELTLWSNRTLFERLPRLVYSILLVVVAFFVLALYFAQRGHNEYLWLALHQLSMAPVGFIELAGTTGRLDSLWYAALVLQLMLISAYLFFEFIISFVALRPHWTTRWMRYTAPLMAGVAPTLLLAVMGHSAAAGITLAIVLLGTLLWMLSWLVFVFATLIAATLRRNFEAGLLLIPLVLSLVGSIEPVMTAGMSQWMGRPYRAPFTILAGPIPIHLASIADFSGVLVIVIIIFGRFLRVQQDQQRASSELAAARSVQELMIPQEKVATPGFEVDSVYSPAQEVGGDFFHVQTMGDGGVLVVIGDVAGKGLKAAMTVSMIMGALRRTLEQSPARILEALNRVLAGSDGFTTCQAAVFGADGELVLANAGHLPPYLNSQEVEVPGGLPLGVLPSVSYEEVQLYLHPGDRVLLLSDGVVEARRPSGELFGFDRVHNLSNQTAFTIADTARTFGQEDDITVLTVRRLAHATAAGRSRHAQFPQSEPSLEGIAS